MKIIVLSDYAFINGGNAQVALTTSVALAKKNYDVTLFTAVGPIADFLINVPNLRVICLNQYDILSDPNRMRAMINGLWNFKARKEFKKLLNNFDKANTIIHIHSCSKALSSSCIQIANKMGFKMVYHLHDYGIACPNMGFYNYKEQKICKLKPLSIKCIMTNCDSRHYVHKIWRVIRQWIQKYISKMSFCLNYIYISEFSFNILKPFLNKRKKIYFVLNPIDVEKENRIHVEDNKNFVFIGRLSPEKNPLLLAKVAKKINVPVIFIGSGQCSKDIKKINNEAELTGWISKNEINSILQKARCLVFPSNWYETQGLVVSEALSKGIPCIVSKNCAAINIISEGETGFSFKNNDFKELEFFMRKMDDNLLIKKMSNKAYEDFWKKTVSMDDYIKNIINIYKNIVKKENKI